MSNKIFKCFLIFIILPVLISTVSYAGKIPHRLLVEDIRQLAHILESSHPDPYIRGGGKIAFHRRFHDLMISIPKEGMTIERFQTLLLPFVASVGDGHTRIHVRYRKNKEQPGGIPLLFSIIEDSLYVSGIFDENYKDLIGSILLSVQDIPCKELCNRVMKLRGTDNELGALVLLQGTNYLYHESQLAHLIPEWSRENITVELRLPSGVKKRITFDKPAKKNRPLITAKSAIQTPATNRCEFAYNFLDKNHKIALLKVDGMLGFREHFELVGLDSQYNLDGARDIYQRYHQKAPSDDKSELLNGIPSATETFKSLVIDMKHSQTDTLIVDLRKNGGGNSTLANFLIYFIFGNEQLMNYIALDRSYEVIKYSNLYFDQAQPYKNETSAAGIKLNDHDYWFEELYERNRFVKTKIQEVHDDMYQKIPTFYQEYKSGKYSNYYRPKNVVVLSSPGTYSSGYTMMRMLKGMGALLVGTPSSQSGNAPGWALNFKLKNSGLTGWVPCKFYISFSDRIKNGVYQVDQPLTYEKLKKYNFDPNSEILFTLDLLKGNSKD